MTTMNTDYFAGLELAQKVIDEAAAAAEVAAKKAVEEKKEAARKERLEMEVKARENRARAQYSVRLAIVQAAISRGSKASTTETGRAIVIDGYDCSHLIDFVEERTSYSTWRSKPNGKTRLTVGDFGDRKSYPQRKDGGYNYEDIAATLCHYAAKKIANDLALANRQRNTAEAAVIRKEFNLPEYHGLVNPSASKGAMVLLDFSKISPATVSPAKAREVLAALRVLGIKLSYND